MNLRLLFAAFLGICLAAPAVTAQTTVHLKPFHAHETNSRTKSLAGVWKGTFIFQRKSDGAREEVAYRMEIAPDLASLTVTAVAPYGSNPAARTSPVTSGPIPADWDGELLRAQSFSRTERRLRDDGEEGVEILKTYVLRPGTDGRHAGVSYRVTVKTKRPHDERSDTVRGSGELVRCR